MKNRLSLEKLHSTELLAMMQIYDESFTRKTKFCPGCKTKAIEKLRSIKINELLERSKATKSEEATGSYSDHSFLSEYHYLIE